jgi:hypothetical protein
MSKVPMYYNTHNVYVKTGLATRAQLETSVAGFKTLLATTFPGKRYEASVIDINLVSDRNGSKGFGFLWAEKPEVYHILCGNNPDGSERIEEVTEETNEANAMPADLDLDMMDMDFDAVFNNMNTNVIRSIRKLPPLLTLPGYRYSEEQSRIAHEALRMEETKAAETEKREPRMVEAPTMGFFSTHPSTTTQLSPQQSPFKLRGEIPLWIDERMLRSHFSKYASNREAGYPRITINPIRNRPDSNSAVIEFSQSYPGDATFALQMTRRSAFVAPPGNGVVPPGAVVEKIFDFYRNFDVNESGALAHRPEPERRPMAGAGGPAPARGGGAFMNRARDNGFATRAVAGAVEPDGFMAVERRRR